MPAGAGKKKKKGGWDMTFSIKELEEILAVMKTAGWVNVNAEKARAMLDQHAKYVADGGDMPFDEWLTRDRSKERVAK